MRPRRTPTMTTVFQLEGGNEDNDLWVRPGIEEDATGKRTPFIESVWSLEDHERQAVAAGDNIVLRIYGTGTPPTALYVTDEQPGR